MNEQSISLYTHVHQSAKMSVAALDALIQSSLDPSVKTQLTHRQNRYKQIAAKAGQALQEYSEQQDGLIPQITNQTAAGINTLTSRIEQDGSSQKAAEGIAFASESLHASMRQNTEATQNAQNLAFALLELQQNDTHSFLYERS